MFKVALVPLAIIGAVVIGWYVLSAAAGLLSTAAVLLPFILVMAGTTCWGYRIITRR